ncbi:hypothetical protein PoB_003700600 [Plakobranchus ocellatus]|uniref:Transmembrane protein n=1 Tax=Plakobranchus ocellatus TaxID=259542 RepID=A0AAV4AVC7_9GAST|nr:hypothetical protein PoB_003700600 [Plakobranchus ocellatus]
MISVFTLYFCSFFLVGAVFSKLRRNRDGQYDIEAQLQLLPRGKRQDQGRHECEIFTHGDEVEESGEAWSTCSKNPGHDTFIPAPEFCLDHLPECARYSSVLELVKLLSLLTVRLRVAFTSWERPKGYTFHNYRGSTEQHVGSGFVQDIIPGHGSCPCRECENSPTPAQEWFCILIETACHVVYDTKEAESTKVDFFYDDASSRTDGRMKSIFAKETILHSQDQDFCAMLCVTHDKRLSQEILQYKQQLDKTYQLYRWYKNKFDDSMMADFYSLCLIVSHPHGHPKHVTVGRTERFIRDDDFMKVSYTTDTCCGSSGAPVTVIDIYKGGNDIFSNKGRGPHSESLCVNGKTLNMSAEFLTMDLENNFKLWAKNNQHADFRRLTTEAIRKTCFLGVVFCVWLFLMAYLLGVFTPDVLF